MMYQVISYSVNTVHITICDSVDSVVEHILVRLKGLKHLQHSLDKESLSTMFTNVDKSVDIYNLKVEKI